MLKTAVIYLVCSVIFCLGFVVGAAFRAGRDTPTPDDFDTQDDQQRKSLCASAELSAMDVTRVRDVQRREEEALGRETGKLWRQYPHLTHPQAQAIAERRRSERRA